MGTIYRNGIEYPGVSGRSYLIHSETIPFRWNSSQNKWVAGSASSYKHLLVDGGFFVEENGSTSATSLKLKVSSDTTKYMPLSTGLYYRLQVTLIRSNSGGTQQMTTSAYTANADQSDRINNFYFRVASGRSYFTMNLNNLSNNESTWNDLVVVVDVYGAKLTLNSTAGM